jgi:hypothetical protein
VGPRSGQDEVEKRKFLTPPELELRPLRRPARSQSLYRLRYTGSFNANVGGIYSDHSALKGRRSVCVSLLHAPYPKRISIFVCSSRHGLLITEQLSIGLYRLSARPVRLPPEEIKSQLYPISIHNCIRFLYSREQAKMLFHGTKYSFHYDLLYSYIAYLRCLFSRRALTKCESDRRMGKVACGCLYNVFSSPNIIMP